MASLGRMNEAFSIFQTLSSETGDSYTSKMHIPAYLQMLLFIVVTMVLLLRYFIQSAIHILPRSQYSDLVITERFYNIHNQYGVK